MPTTVRLPPLIVDLGAKARAGRIAARESLPSLARGDLRGAWTTARNAYDGERTIQGHRPVQDPNIQLARIAQEAEGREKQPITILGSGMAGLVQAYEAERLGIPVRAVIEGNDRLGGRLWTHRFEDGTYHELGGMRIPKSHAYTRHYIDAMGLPLRKFVSVGDNPNGLIDAGGDVVRAEKATAELAKKFGVSDAELKSLPPQQVMKKHLGGLADSLSETEKQSLFSTRLSSRRLERLDRTTTRDYLLSRGVSPEMLKLMDALTHVGQHLHDPVTTQLRSQLEGLTGGLDEIEGGMDRLPLALADKISAPVQMNTRVLGIRTLKNGKVELTLQQPGGDPYVELHDKVVSTLPLSVQRELETDFSAEKREAAGASNFQKAVKVIVHTPDAQPYEETGLAQGMAIAHGTGFTHHASNHAPEDTGAPGAAILGSYTQAEEARRLAGLTPDERLQAVEEQLERFHPGLRVDDAAEVDWSREPFARGAFTLQDSGLNDRARVLAKREGNVIFATDGLRRMKPGWIDGAIGTSLDALEEVVRSFPYKTR